MIDDFSVNPSILTINGGSSSIKFSLFEAGESLTQVFKGSIDRIGHKEATFQVNGLELKEEVSLKVPASDLRVSVNLLIDWILQQSSCSHLIAIGHRVVHGGPKYSNPLEITEGVIRDLHDLIPFAPDHLPEEILLIEAFRHRFPNIPQFACFDTAFHQSLPCVAKLLPIPRHYQAEGIRRYGFHGLSYEFLMQELKLIAGTEAAQGRLILAHLGSGVSLAAVYQGKSIDTSMSFTPTAGVPMSTRSGDLDPGLFGYLAATRGMSVEQWNEMVNFKSGLLGISETSSDIRDLLQVEGTDSRAAEAISLFCYQVKKWIGSFAAALGGIDTLIFSGGVGENLQVVRSRICEGLGFLGIELDEKKNESNEGVISTASSNVVVRVMRTNEEKVIAQTIHHMVEIKGIK